MKQESKIIDKQVFDLTDALRAPVLTADQSWASAIPDRILDLVVQSRMLSLIIDDKMATYPEVIAYLMTATLRAPIPSEWIEIYTHVSCKVCEDHFGEDHWKEIDALRKLDQYKQEQLDMLRRMIYAKRRTQIKQRLKEMKKIENNEISNPEPIKVVQSTQMSLWDS